jgi:hypothetical protein
MLLPSRRATVFMIAAPAILTLSRTSWAAGAEPATPRQMEGPYYKAGAPERQMLIEREGGPRLVLTGQVIGPDCRPVPGAYSTSGMPTRPAVTTTAAGASAAGSAPTAKAATGSRRWCPAPIPAARATCM